MANVYTIGIGAGIASALLFAATSTLTPIAVLISYIAPLPVVIASLGWTPWTGLFAIAIAGASLSLTIGSTFAIGYALGVGGPAWLLSALLLLRQPVEGAGSRWVRPGVVLLASAILAGFVTLMSAIAVGGGSFATYADAMRQVVDAMIRMQANVPTGQPLPSGSGSSEIAEALVSFFPIAIGASVVPLIVANVWAGAKIVAVSGRLPRPWIAAYATRMPHATLPILVVALACSMLDGFVGVLAKGLMGAGIAVLAIQGLAAIHDRTLGKASRPLILGLLYGLLILTLGWAMPALAIVGFIDMLSNRRSGASAASSPFHNNDD